MMKITIKQKHKSINPHGTFELPDFCVLTGKNGSGKSHLLEALTKKEVTEIRQTEKEITEIKYIPFGGLNPQMNSDCDYLTLINERSNKWKMVKNGLSSYKRDQQSRPSVRLNWENYFRDKKQQKEIRRLLRFIDDDITKFDEEVFNKYYGFTEDDSNSLFTAQIANIFQLYYIRKENNNYHMYRAEIKGEDTEYLSDDYFKQIYGPEPWDLINDMMSKAHLPYQVNHPTGNKENSFHLCLQDVKKGIEIQVNDLSTGEKVLMSLALAIYNTTEEGQKPDLLLLDEPDAPLHPEYSNFLIDSIKHSIVEKAGVKVIITTHSPTTVAMADEESLYRMDKEEGIPVKTSKETAIALLTKGINNLRVSVESRRQVFVESKFDVHYYEKLFELIDSETDVHPCFLASNSTKTTNCTDVINIVEELTRLGNDLVYGIIDFDNTNHTKDKVLVNGENKRYTIENYLFDPIYVAFLLIHENIPIIKEDSEFKQCRYSDIRNQNTEYIQELIEIVEKVLNFSGNRTTYQTKNGNTYTVSEEYFKMKGHDLEEKIVNNWPSLKAITKGQSGDEKLKNYILDTIISDYPEYLSSDFVKLFQKIV